MEILKNKKSYKASVTVEAALSFTLTIFILFMIIGPLFIIRKSSDVLTEMNTLNKLACYYEESRYQINKNATSSEPSKKLNDYIEDFDEAENYINAGYVLYHLYDSYRDKESLRGCDLYPAATAASLLTGPVIFNCHGVILPLFNY